MRTPFEQSNATVLVDKTLGTAYETVKELADRVDLLDYLALNMESIVRAATVSQESVKIEDSLPARGSSKVIPFPTGISATNVMAIHAKAFAGGTYYMSGAGEAITTTLSSSGIIIALNNAAPLPLDTAPVSILVIAVG